MAHWFAFAAGLTNPNSWTYLFWSGLGSDIAKVTILGGLAHHWWAGRCHVRGCWRTGRFPVAGTPWTVCAKHHPARLPTAEEVSP